MTTTAPSPPAPARPARRGLWLAVALASVVVVVTALAVTVTLLVRGAGFPGMRGSGVTASETRTVPAFTAVELAGANEVIVQVGQPQRVEVRADDNLLGRVVTEVRGDVLVVSNRGSFSTRGPMSVVVTVPSLRAATLSGAGQLTVTGVAVDSFTARLSGTGTLAVQGRAESLDASVSGSGSLSLESLVATDATVTVSGTGSVTVHVTRALDATVSGTGSIEYSGHPASVTKNVTGIGSITGS